MRPTPPLILAVALTLTALGAVQEAIAFSYQVRKVLFLSDRLQGRRHVFLMDSNGLHVVQLTGGTANEASPSFTHDGRVLFASDRSGSWQIYLMNLDGTGVQQLTAGEANNHSPAPARDGSVVFVSDRNNSLLQLFLLKPGATEPKLLTLTDREETNLSPVVTEEMEIVFSGRRQGRQRIWRMAMDGSRLQEFPTTLTGLLDSPAVIPSAVRDPLAVTPTPPTGYTGNTGLLQPMAPPQNRLVFSSQNGPVTDIYRMGFDGQDLQKLTNTGGFNGYPVALKDGRILYTSDHGGSLNVWIMTPDGQRQANLTNQTGRYNATR